MNKPIIIGFSGKKKSGKGSACRFLTANAGKLWGEGASVGTFSMAGPLKKVCLELLGLRHEQLYGSNEQKDMPTRYRWEDLPHHARLPGQPTGIMTGRQVMQHIGTMFRMLDTDIFVAACLRSIQASNVQVAFIDDIRFPNEVALVQQAGGVVYRLTRDVFAGQDQHESETKLDRDVYDWNNFDGVIVNDNLTVAQTNRLVVLDLYEDGLLHQPIRRCNCCDGLDVDELCYPE